jgi:hypothetical protein
MNRIRLQQLNERPWRFKTGDRLFVRGWHQGQTVTVRRRAAGTFPTYWVIDEWGDSWRIAQIELSSRPIAPDA